LPTLCLPNLSLLKRPHLPNLSLLSGGSSVVRHQQLINKTSGSPVVTTAEFDAHMRGLECCDGMDPAPEIDLYLSAAIAALEQYLGIAIGEQEWELLCLGLKRFEANTPIMLPRWPVRDVLNVSRFDAGQAVPYQPSDYWVNTSSRLTGVCPKGSLWRTGEQSGGVSIRYSAGYGAADLPRDLRLAILMLAGHYWENRLGEPVQIPFAAQSDGGIIPPTIRQILRPYQSWISA
jgi:uncharacterized phiE125 gp8 family phage protein